MSFMYALVFYVFADVLDVFACNLSSDVMMLGTNFV